VGDDEERLARSRQISADLAGVRGTSVAFSPEYLAIEKLVGYLTSVLQEPHRAGLAHATPMGVVDMAIRIIEDGRKLTLATFEALEPRLRKMIREITAESEPRDGT
jgi:hypothetical protein